MITLWIFLYFTILGIGIMSLFTEFRFSRKRTLCWLGFFTAAILLLDIFLYPRIDLVLFRRLYPLINHLPITLLMAYLGKNHGWRLVFQLLSSVLFCCLILHTAALIYLWSGRLAWVLLPAYGVTTLLGIWFLLRYLRPLYLQTVRSLRNGWPVICLILLIYYGLIFYVIPGYVGESTISTVSYTHLMNIKGQTG